MEKPHGIEDETVHGKYISVEIFRKFSTTYGVSGAEHRAERMLNAAMAGAALVAVADGHASFEEGAEASNVANILQALRIFDPLTGLKLYHDYIHLALEGEHGKEALREVVRTIADEEDERVMLIEICHAISRADDKVVTEEWQEISKIASYLRLSAPTQD